MMLSTNNMNNIGWPNTYEVMNATVEEHTYFVDNVTQDLGQIKISLPPCNITQESQLLGPITVRKVNITLRYIEKWFPNLRQGGRYIPSNCAAMHKVAIIVPFRDRHRQLHIFLNHMHNFLMKQQIKYGIFIIEQDGVRRFNRGKLFNVGFMEAQRLEEGWQCFIFHDIDLLPLDTRNLYTCPTSHPRHMSASIDIYNFRLPYSSIFGGVSALTMEQFVKVNGFSNRYWGWGGEDDDMSFRLKKEGYHIERYKMDIARYTSLHHALTEKNPARYRLLQHMHSHYHPEKDGLTTLVYDLKAVEEYHLYTHVLANIDKRYHYDPKLMDIDFYS